ncbi:MAG: hypothetical protein HFJ80_07400 [Clostridiales bacterium]|nr:hypothetical protein [Clostridiales bacterium]
MAQGKMEDAGGLAPAKDDNAALHRFNHRTLPIFRRVDYMANPAIDIVGERSLASPPRHIFYVVEFGSFQY